MGAEQINAISIIINFGWECSIQILRRGTSFVWSFRGVETAGVWGWPPTPSSAEALERAELYLYSP